MICSCGFMNVPTCVSCCACHGRKTSRRNELATQAYPAVTAAATATAPKTPTIVRRPSLSILNGKPIRPRKPLVIEATPSQAAAADAAAAAAASILTPKRPRPLASAFGETKRAPSTKKNKERKEVIVVGSDDDDDDGNATPPLAQRDPPDSLCPNLPQSPPSVRRGNGSAPHPDRRRLFPRWENNDEFYSRANNGMFCRKWRPDLPYFKQRIGGITVGGALSREGCDDWYDKYATTFEWLYHYKSYTRPHVVTRSMTREEPHLLYAPVDPVVPDAHWARTWREDGKPQPVPRNTHADGDSPSPISLCSRCCRFCG